jgi:ferritin-like metal-binding protein YciE
MRTYARNEVFMSDHLTTELLAYVSDACALERLSLQLLQLGLRRARDAKVAGIYRGHAVQTEDHLRLLGECVGPRAATDSEEPAAVSVGALRVASGTDSADTPTHLAIGVYALENVEIALYHLLVGIAQDAGATDTAATLRRILEQEEETVELLASTLDRVLPDALADATSRGRS